MDSALLAYLPMDRRHALAEGRELPERTEGTALFADISGFTPLTEALTLTLGPRRGAEELTRHLNWVYDALIDQVHQHGGSVIGFAGDAITCWFDQDTGLRATACALAMQAAIRPFAELLLPSGQTTSLHIKVAVAGGPVQRFLVGDPDIQLLEVLAGQTLTHLAEAEALAHKGEVVLDPLTAGRLMDRLHLSGWRDAEQGGGRVAIVGGLRQPVSPTPWLPLAETPLAETQLRPWLIPVVYERLQAGHGEFLTELRPAVALFLRFAGIDYEGDERAGSRLDAYIRWVQQVLTRYDASMTQLTIGDKGSYLYAAFGAPIAHEDDAERAVNGALELRQPPSDFGIASVQVGISRGTMRTGAYGGREARTYGSLGDEVNLAARLMQRAAPGQVLASGRIQHATRELFHWQSLPAVQVKGKAEPIPLFALLGHRPPPTIHLQEPSYHLPMVGREGELAHIEAKMELALAGQGQLVGITGEAGMGKSRLVAEVVRRANGRGLVGYGGECQSYGTTMPYLVWQPIWRTLFNLDEEAPLAEQVQTLSEALQAIDPELLPRLPLLGIVLNLPLADNELTHSFDASLRKSSREALLVDVLHARAEQARRAGSALLLVLEDAHWLDTLSHDLLEVIGRACTTMPLLIVLAYRPPELTRLQAPRVVRLPHFSEITLGELAAPEMKHLIQARVWYLTAQVGRPVSERLLGKIVARAEGTPFYAEELLNYLYDQGIDPWEESALERLELPTSLHSLVLSRIDQLTEAQKITIKVASVIGRVFSFTWLTGYYPGLGTAAQIRTDLEELRRLDLTPLEQPEPELTYLFKHIVTQEVAYESMAYERRATLHEQLALYLEGQPGASEARYLDLLAYHYDRSENLPKKRAYLHRAGEAAQAAYANEAAIDYYERLLPLLTDEERGAVLLALGDVLQVTGQYDAAEGSYRQALLSSERLGDPLTMMRAQRALGTLYESRGEYREGLVWFEQAEAGCRALDAWEDLSRTLAEKGTLIGRLGDYALALQTFDEGLAIAEQRRDVDAMIQTLHNIGFVHSNQGTYSEAQHCFEKALALAEQQGDKVKISTSLHGLANLAYFQSDFVQMERYGKEVLAMRMAMGHKRGIAMQRFNLGLVYLQKEDHPFAREHFEESLRLFVELGDKLGTAVLLSVLGEMEHEAGANERAQEILEQALGTLREVGDKMRLAGTLILLALVKIALGKAQEARALSEEAQTLAQEMGDTRTLMRAYGQLGRSDWAQGKMPQAHENYCHALRLAHQLGEKLWDCELLAALAGLRLAWQGLDAEVVRRCAAVRAELGRLQIGLSRQNRDILEETIQVAQQQMEKEDFATAWREGEALSRDDAVTQALEEVQR